MPLGPPFVRILGEPGRRLTQEEVEEEIRRIETWPWPHNSVLPMKNLYDGQMGCIFRTFDGGPETIVSEIVLADKKGELKYPTVKAMVEAGWVGD